MGSHLLVFFIVCVLYFLNKITQKESSMPFSSHHIVLILRINQKKLYENIDMRMRHDHTCLETILLMDLNIYKNNFLKIEKIVQYRGYF